MLIKLIYEDETLPAIKEAISLLESKQFYFLERFIRQEKAARKLAVFNQWQHYLAEQVDTYCIK